jgi:hypothetical protein
MAAFIWRSVFNQAFPPAQPDLFLADEIERLKIAPVEPPKLITNGK